MGRKRWKEFVAPRSGSSTMSVESVNSVSRSPPSFIIQILRRGVAVPSRPCASYSVGRGGGEVKVHLAS
jgi:hypothetical protein